jgi:excisionase family DNA binding protein
MKAKLLTVTQAANLKSVTRSAIYSAIKEGRLPHRKVLGHFALCEADVLAWTPTPSTGRRKGTQMSEESKARISQAQKRRWAHRRENGQT